jgi:hypothetical protein
MGEDCARLSLLHPGPIAISCSNSRREVLFSTAAMDMVCGLG